MEEAIWDLLLVVVSVLLGKAIDLAEEAMERRRASEVRGKHAKRP